MSKRVRFIIFTILIGGALLLAVLSGIVYAYTGSCDDIEAGTIFIIYCYVINIHAQNDQIIEKLDWNNCAISHKSTRNYEYTDDDSWVWNASTNFAELEEECGEMP